ncbi:sporulation protein YpjB [Peribacillus frigoritolerans]|nr:sporulation protein YpjB [Peribacillus frigoritolerans]
MPKKVNSVTKFRLVVDAVKSTHQPLLDRDGGSNDEFFPADKECRDQSRHNYLQ